MTSALRAEPTPDCLAAARRYFEFLVQEAVDTRHAAQIAGSVARKGEAAVVAEIAAGMKPEQCVFLLVAPDSSVRAMAVTALPARNGK